MRRLLSSSFQSPQSFATRWLVGAACLIMALALAGCGVTINVGGSGDSSTPGDVGSSTPGSIPGAGGGTSIRPCTGASVAPSKTPTIILTVKDSYKTTQAHVGDVILIQLDAMTHWSTPNDGATTVLSALQPQGGMDQATQTCRWLYAAVAAGTAKLDFTGSPICESGVACPAIARAEIFTIQVS